MSRNELEKMRAEFAAEEDALAKAMKLDGPRERGKEGFDGQGHPSMVRIYFADRKFLGESGFLDMRIPINWLWARNRLGAEPENTRRYKAGLIFSADYYGANPGAAPSSNMVFVDKSRVSDGSAVSQLDAASRHHEANQSLDGWQLAIAKAVVLDEDRLERAAKRFKIHPTTAKRFLLKALDRLAVTYGSRVERMPLFSLNK